MMEWITDIITTLKIFFNQIYEFAGDYIIVITLVSIITFFASLILIPVLIIKIPEDYFIRCKKEFIKSYFKHPILRMIVHIIKNFLGGVFILTGFAMLFIPGQGLLTMLIGSTLMDLPHKKDLEYKIIRRPHIYKAINLLRHKAGKKSILLKHN